SGCARVAQVPAGPPAHVHFEAKGSATNVKVVDAAGASAECHAPCDVTVASGTATIEVGGGAGPYTRKPVIPEGSAAATVERSSKSLVTTSRALTFTAIGLGVTPILLFQNAFYPTIAFEGASFVCASIALVLALSAGKDEVDIEPGRSA